jgi:apolipoprotein N-acyltransferase
VALSVPPAGFWPLGIVGLAGLAWHFDRRGARGRAVAGMAFGVGLFGVTIAWVISFQAFGYVALVLLESSFFAAAGAATAGGARTGTAVRMAAFTAAVTLAEGLRSSVPWGGFPLGGIPLGQVGGPLVPVARLGGVLALTAATAAVAAVLAELARPRPGRRGGAAVLAVVGLAPVLAVTAAGAASPDGHVVGRLDVAAVQGGGPRGLRGVEGDTEVVTQRQVDATRLITGRPSVILWPEDVVQSDRPVVDTPVGPRLAEIARAAGATLLVGVVEDVGTDRFRNAVVAWGPGGQVVARYDKVHRVPFGEYAPGRDLVAKVASLRLLPRDAIAGRGPGILRTPEADLGVVVSFEVFFGGRARAAARAGAQVLLVPTNAASYRTSQVPDQEVAAARLQAWETGRDIVQAAPTGFSALIGPRGRVTRRSHLGRRQVVEGPAALRSGRTPYVRWGDGPWWGLATLLLVVPRGWRWRRRPGDAGPPTPLGVAS